MKKFIPCFLALALSAAAFNGTVAMADEKDETTPASTLEEITNDFTGVTSNLLDKENEMFASVGETYENYLENNGLIDEWITLVHSETDELFERTRDNSIQYFKLVANDPDHQYREFCDDAMDEYYDTVYDEVLDEYYEDIYEDAMDDLYDKYYDGIIEDAEDDVEFTDWLDTSSECYQTWLDGRTAIYQTWLDERSYIYGLWTKISSAFCWNDNFDVDSIVAEYEQKLAEKEAEQPLETDKPAESAEQQLETDKPAESAESAGTLRPEFKEAMDSYKEFYVEYCDFMAEYNANPTDLTLLTEYSDMLVKAQEMNEAFESWDQDELNSEELKYYLDINNEVMKMLVDVTG